MLYMPRVKDGWIDGRLSHRKRDKSIDKKHINAIAHILTPILSQISFTDYVPFYFYFIFSPTTDRPSFLGSLARKTTNKFAWPKKEIKTNVPGEPVKLKCAQQNHCEMLKIYCFIKSLN